MHVRTQIRNALKTLLTGLPLTGTNVFTSRVTDYNRATELPAINIVINEEEFDRADDSASIGHNSQIRDIVIEIQCRAAAVGIDNIDDDLDALALAVEIAVAGDNNLSGLLFYNSYTGTTLEIEDEAETATGLVTVSYGAQYVVDASDPETVVT